MKTYWVYILYCSNHSFYTGYTDDLKKRYQSHVNGTGSKYTRSFKPLSILQCWEVSGGKSQAMKLERLIKKLSRSEKENIVANPFLMTDEPLIQVGVLPII